MLVWLSCDGAVYGISMVLIARRSSIAAYTSETSDKGQGQVEDLARVDMPRQDSVEQVGQVRASRSWAAAPADVAPEHVGLRDVGYVGDTDPTDHATGTGGFQRLDGGLVGADALQDGVGTDAVRELLDGLDAVVASLSGVHQMQSKAGTREPICAR